MSPFRRKCQHRRKCPISPNFCGKYCPPPCISIFISVRRIRLSVDWGEAFGHIDEEEKLKARIAKKEKAMTQIEMDIYVQDIG
jgi:hypothetical protein